MSRYSGEFNSSITKYPKDCVVTQSDPNAPYSNVNYRAQVDITSAGQTPSSNTNLWKPLKNTINATDGWVQADFAYEDQDFEQYPFNDDVNGMSITWKLTLGAPCGEVEGQCSNPAKTTKSACQSAAGTWTPCDDPALTV